MCQSSYFDTVSVLYRYYYNDNDKDETKDIKVSIIALRMMEFPRVKVYICSTNTFVNRPGVAGAVLQTTVWLIN